MWAANQELTHEALIAFQNEALRIARADAGHLKDGVPQHWADPVAIAKKLFTTNTGYGVQLVRGWLTNAGIPTSKTQYEIGQVDFLAGPGSPAVNAAAAGNRHTHTSLEPGCTTRTSTSLYTAGPRRVMSGFSCRGGARRPTRRIR